MSAERRFSEPLTRCRRQCVMPVWWWVLVGLLCVFLLAALVMVWCWREEVRQQMRTGVSALPCALPSSRALPMAWAPMPVPVTEVWGLLVWGSAAFTLFASFMAWKHWRASRQQEVELRWAESATAEDLETPKGELPADELRRIVCAITAEVCAARNSVSRAQVDLSVEDYGEKLLKAERSLNQVVDCLAGLMGRLGPTQNALELMVPDEVSRRALVARMDRRQDALKRDTGEGAMFLAAVDEVIRRNEDEPSYSRGIRFDPLPEPRWRSALPNPELFIRKEGEL